MPDIGQSIGVKIFPLQRRANQPFNFARLPRQEGRSRSSRTCGGMRWTLMSQRRVWPLAYGEIVWVRRPDAGVKFDGGQRCPRAMVSQKAGSPGRSRISRKAIAQGRPDASAKPVCSWAAYLFANSLRDRGCGAHPVFPAPSISEGKALLQNSGRIAPRERAPLPVSPDGIFPRLPRPSRQARKIPGNKKRQRRTI
jgi:hypothetical protein